jgi:AAT family amino acid transporter
MDSKVRVKEVEKEELNRGLKNRHIQMIAIGGAIGVGLFYGSAGAIQMAGPAVILSYLVVGVAIFFIMRALGEMSVAEPVSGSYSSYANRYLGRFAGFFLGWNLVFTMAVGSAAEYNALGRYVQFWFPHVPIWVSAAGVLILISIINLIAVAAFGEFEFWFSMVKVVAIVAMIILGLCMIVFGIGNSGHPVGFGNLVNNGGFFPKGLSGFILSLVLVAFAFGGVESVGYAAGETSDVKATIPKAINSIFWRIMIFYVGAISVMLILYPWQKIGTEGSPFVMIFSKMGIPAAAAVINFVVITAAISTMNSGIYGSSRMLYNMALQHNAPSALGKVNARGVPYLAIFITIVTQVVGVLVNYLMPGKAFAVFSSIVVFGLVAGWVAILLCQLKFRRVKIDNHEEDKLFFKMPLWPYSNYFALAFMFLIVVILGIIPDTRVALYVAPVWILVLFLFYKIYIAKADVSAKRLK